MRQNYMQKSAAIRGGQVVQLGHGVDHYPPPLEVHEGGL